MKNIKLVAADVDGTLYGETRIITERTRKAIDALKEKGILFALASGRDIENMRAYPFAWGFNHEFDGYIGMNGAKVYDYNNDKSYAGFVMTHEELKMLIKHLEHFDLNCSIFCDDGVIYNYRMDEQVRRSMERNKEAVNHAILDGDLTKIAHLGVNKLCYRIEEERMPELEQYMKDHPVKGYSGFKTQPIYYEIMLEGVNKGTGLEKYCEMNGISLDEVVAFGDTSNDNEMLKRCHGVCLLNGSDDTKACAKEITEYIAEEDGLAIWLEKNLLND